MDLIINYPAVLAGAIVAMGLGFLWYSPLLFGKEWMRLMGITHESMQRAQQKGMTLNYALQALGALMMSFVLAYAAVAFGVVDVVTALQLGFWAWAGFVAPVQLGMILWEGKSWKLFWITSGYYLVSLICMSIVLALWQ